jgi:uncharacterized protein YjdB
VNVQATQSYSLTVNPTPVPVLSFTQAGPLQIILGNSLTNAVSSTLSGGNYGAVTYTSSNPAVATVDAAGKVTTVSAGTVTITATQAAVVGVNVQATQSYSLTVNPTPVPVLSFTQAGPLQIILGNSLTNAVSSTLTGGSYGAVTYISSNPAVATVDAAGKVTTVSAGTVTITATQAAVVGVNVQATQSYSLTVNPTPVPVLSFTQAGPLQIILGNSLTNAVSSTLTGGSYGAVTYISSNPAVATVDAAGKVTTVSAGTVTITATQAAVVGVNVQATQSYSLTVVKNVQAALVLTADKTAIYKNTGKATISVAGGSGSGAVTLALTSGNCSLSGNVLSAGTTAGNCVVTATKAADATYNAASGSITIQVQNLTVSSVSLAATQTQVMESVPVTLSASVNPAGSTGSISFMDGAVKLATVPLNNGTASFVTKDLAVGSHSITASYSGDATTEVSTSTAVVITVGKRPDPSSNAVVKSTAVSSVSTSQRFVQAQLTNMHSHFQVLHHDFAIRNRFDIGLNAPNLNMVRMAADKIAANLGSTEDTSSSGAFRSNPVRGRRQHRKLPVPVKTVPTMQNQNIMNGSASVANRLVSGQQVISTSVVLMAITITASNSPAPV